MKDFFNSPEVKQDENAKSLSYFCTKGLVMINNQIILQLIEESKKNNSCDIRLSLHKDPSDKHHNMIILQHKGNYYRPHKHLAKPETYHLIKGKMAVFIFNDTGVIIDSVILDPQENFIYRIGANNWHVSIPLTEHVIFNESKPGPFIRQGDSIFAEWAHDGNNNEETTNHTNKLLQTLNLEGINNG
jgi:cupin fold WbuC family metalloprotein